MARVSPRPRCNSAQISRSLLSTGIDCRRRIRSSNRNPPALRKLNRATPRSHASTIHGNKSGAVDRDETSTAGVEGLHLAIVGSATVVAGLLHTPTLSAL